MQENNSEKGQAALLITMVITSLVFFMGLFVTNIAVKQTKVALDVRNSVQAFYNADFGIEAVLDEIGQSLSIEGVTDLGNDALSGSYPYKIMETSEKEEYDVYITDNSGIYPDDPELIVQVIGFHNSTARSMELSWSVY